MKTENFQKLIQAITGRDFIINTNDEELILEKEYWVYRTLPITNKDVGFYFITPKVEEKLLKVFITSFINKYFEPNPQAYNKTYGGIKYTWEEKTEKEKEQAYRHHKSNMYSKEKLLEQIYDNFNTDIIEDTLLRYGFYPTTYGVGIFCYFQTNSVMNSISKMKQFLTNQNIPYKNEFSDAKWVYRFKININKDKHYQILKSFQ